MPMMRCAIIKGAIAPLFLGEHQELRRKLTHRVTIERDMVRDPEAIEH
jgi:hypothetical protein